MGPCAQNIRSCAGSHGGRRAAGVRSWTSWHRWTILAPLACAFLSVLAATQPDDGHPRDDQLIPLTPIRDQATSTAALLASRLPRPQPARAAATSSPCTWLSLPWSIKNVAQ